MVRHTFLSWYKYIPICYFWDGVGCAFALFLWGWGLTWVSCIEVNPWECWGSSYWGQHNGRWHMMLRLQSWRGVLLLLSQRGTLSCSKGSQCGLWPQWLSFSCFWCCSMTRILPNAMFLRHSCGISLFWWMSLCLCQECLWRHLLGILICLQTLFPHVFVLRMFDELVII